MKKLLCLLAAATAMPPMQSAMAMTMTLGAKQDATMFQNNPDNGSGAAVLKGLPPALSKKVLQAAPGISRRRLLVVPLGELADRLAISIEEAAALRRAALGLETPPSSKAATWDRPTKVGSKQVATRPPRRSADPTPPPPKTAGSRATGARAPRQPRS